MPRCKSCGAHIEYIVLESGKKAPVNVPNAIWSAKMGQNVVVKIVGRPGFVMRVPEDQGGITVPLIEVFTSHFATCPDAAIFRKGTN